MAAHKARLHLKTERIDHWASKQGAAQSGATHAHTGPAAPSRLSAGIARASPDQEDTAFSPERSSISASWARVKRLSPLTTHPDLALGMPESPMGSPRRPPIRRFGSAVTGDSQASSPMSRPHPPAVTIAEIMRQGSVATPTGVGRSQPPSPRRLPHAVTVAQIMRQNTHLTPLDFVPPSPSGWAQAPSSPVTRGFSLAASPSSFSSPRSRHGPGFAPPVTTHASVAAGYVSGGLTTQSGSPDYLSHPGAGSVPVTPRRRLMLPPLSPTRSGWLSPGADSHSQRSPNK